MPKVLARLSKSFGRYWFAAALLKRQLAQVAPLDFPQVEGVTRKQIRAGRAAVRGSRIPLPRERHGVDLGWMPVESPNQLAGGGIPEQCPVPAARDLAFTVG